MLPSQPSYFQELVPKKTPWLARDRSLGARRAAWGGGSSAASKSGNKDTPLPRQSSPESARWDGRSHSDGGGGVGARRPLEVRSGDLPPRSAATSGTTKPPTIAHVAAGTVMARSVLMPGRPSCTLRP